MNFSFAAVRWCGAEQGFDKGYRVLKGIHGGMRGYTYSITDGGAPPIVWFESDGERNAGLEELATAFPGVMYCPVNVTSGSMCPPGNLKNLTISDKGILPA